MQTSILSCICGKGQLVTDVESGEIVCNHCGRVIDRVQESRAEWRTFDSDSVDKSRVGSPTSLAYHDMGLATVIGKANRDSSGRRLDASISDSYFSHSGCVCNVFLGRAFSAGQAGHVENRRCKAHRKLAC